MENMKPATAMEGDSCVAVYWPEQTIKPKERRHMAMTYGLGKLEFTDRLALSAPATVAPGREFVVTAYVYNAKKGEKVTLELPAGVHADRQEPQDHDHRALQTHSGVLEGEGNQRKAGR